MSTSGTGSSGASSSETSSAAATSPPASSVGDESTGAVEVPCGNGIVERGEACDDGDRIDGDGCDALCRVSIDERWRATFDFHGTCPRTALLADDALALAGLGDRDEVAAQWQTVRTLVLAPDGTERSSAQSPSEAGHREVWGLAARGEGFVALGRRIELDVVTPFVQPWSADGIAGEDVAISDLGDGSIEAVAVRGDGVLWLVEREGAELRVVLRGEPPTPPLASWPLDDLGGASYDTGHRIVADSDEAYLRTNDLGDWLQRRNPDGAFNWGLRWDDVADPPPAFGGIALASDGDLVAVGRISEAPWVRRHRASRLRWAIDVQIGELVGKDYPREVVARDDGTIVVAGESRVPSEQDDDAWYPWLAGYDEDGTELWRRRFDPAAGEPVGTTLVCALGSDSTGALVLVTRGPAGTTVARYEASG